MDLSFLYLLISFLLSVVLTGILIPKILVISFSKNLFDVPDERKIHKSMVPRLGGIAFMPSIFFSMAAMVGLNALLPVSLISTEIVVDPVAICSGMCAVMLVYLVGIADDLIGVKYRAKFAAQILAALFLVSSGCWIHNLDGFLGIYEMPAWGGIPLTVLVIVYVMNAVNLIDGIDGLSSGLASIALALYAFTFYDSSMLMFAMLSAASLGTLISFFYYNVFGDAKAGRKIFMGDAGTLTVGLVITYMAIHASNIAVPVSIGKAQLDTFVIGFAPLIVPCFDVLRVFGNRIHQHRNPFTPDKTHIHHRLLACGLSQRWAMLIIVGGSALLTALNVAAAMTINITWLVFLDLFVVFGANQLLLAIARRREEGTGVLSEATPNS